MERQETDEIVTHLGNPNFTSFYGANFSLLIISISFYRAHKNNHRNTHYYHSTL